MIKQFVTDFFEATSSAMEETDGVLEVRLSDELQEVFRQPVLRLVFDPHDVSEDTELVCHGSYVLNAIHQYLQDRGAKTVSRLRDKYKTTPEEIQKLIRIENGAVTNVRLKKIKTVDLIFNFKASFLSDEKSEEIYRIGIDRHGVIFQADAYYRDEQMKDDMTSLTQLSAVDVSRKAVESHFRDCLKAASGQARMHAKSIQNDILKRLHRNIARIKGYYSAQIEELHRNQPTYEEKRVAIEREYRHKLSEEIANHRLRIVLKLINMQIVERSETDVHIRFRQHGSVSERPYQLIFDTYTGELDYGACPMCQASMEVLVVTGDLQVACQHCSYTCSHCGKISGNRERSQQCHNCGSQLCPECVILCRDCKKPACNEHADLCAIGNEWVCSDCMRSCSVCGKILCSEHAFVCAKSNQPVCYEHRLICKHCRKVFSSEVIKKTGQGVKCPSCKVSW